MTFVLSSACVTNNHEYVGVEVDGRWLGRAEQGQHQQVRRGLRRRQERPEVHHVRLGPRRQRVAWTAPGSYRYYYTPILPRFVWAAIHQYYLAGLLQRVNPYQSLADGGVFELTQVVCISTRIHTYTHAYLLTNRARIRHLGPRQWTPSQLLNMCWPR